MHHVGHELAACTLTILALSSHSCKYTVCSSLGTVPWVQDRIERLMPSAALWRRLHRRARASCGAPWRLQMCPGARREPPEAIQ